MHATERRDHLDADGPHVRLRRGRTAGPRRRRAAARHRQARAAAASAPSRRALLAERAQGLRGARRPRRAAGAADGARAGRDAGDRAAPRACRRQRLSAEAQHRPDDARVAHRRAGQPLRQPVQSASAGPRADAARVAVAAVRAGPGAVRHRDPRRLHPDDGRLPAGLDGAADRRPLRAGRRGEFVAPAEAARAAARSRRCRATRRWCSTWKAASGPRHPPQHPAAAAAAGGAAIPGAAAARRLLLRAGLGLATRRHEPEAARSRGSADARGRPQAGSALLDALPDAVLLVDAAQQVVAANRAAGTLFGVAAASLLGRAMPDLAATPEDLAFWREAAAGVAERLDSESWLRRADGTVVPVVRRIEPALHRRRGALRRRAARPQRRGRGGVPRSRASRPSIRPRSNRLPTACW